MSTHAKKSTQPPKISPPQGQSLPLRHSQAEIYEPRSGSFLSRSLYPGTPLEAGQLLGDRPWTHDAGDQGSGLGQRGKPPSLVPGFNTAHVSIYPIQRLEEAPLEQPKTSRPTLRFGSTGASVQELQQKLNAHGSEPALAVDGIFGPKTLKAVKAFQGSHIDATGQPLSADGIVGPLTWGSLDLVAPAPQPEPQPTPTPEVPTINPQPDGDILGSFQAERAKTRFTTLSPEEQVQFVQLLKQTGTPGEQLYLYKALAAGHSLGEIETFAARIRGQDADWLQNHLRLTNSTTGTGVQQQWSHSCNATTAQAVRGEMDPIYALRLHDENPSMAEVNDSDATEKNPKLAEQQRAMLESNYAGTKFGAHSGVAADRGNAGAGSGRWADDLLNADSGATGLQYGTLIVDTDITLEDAIAKIDQSAGQGMPIPIVIGNGADQFTHYVLVTNMNSGPPKTYRIHDPWEGKTSTRTEEDLKNGTIDLAGSNQITAIESPDHATP